MQLPEVVTDHSFLADELLIPNVNKNDGSRTNMVCSHLGQLLVLKDPEIPLVYTNFENQVGKYSTGVRFSKGETTILKVITLHQYKRAIFYTDEDGALKVFIEKHSRNLTESFGYVNHSSVSAEGQKFEDGEVIERNGMYDEIGNFRYGVNLRTVYLPYKGKTYEDPLVISESAAKKLTHHSVHVYDVVLNRNDVLSHPLPTIGSEVEDGILCKRRRINSAGILIDFKGKLDDNHPDDTPFLANGTVTDIEIFCNSPEDLEYPYNAYLKELEENQQKFYSQISTFLNKRSTKKLKFSEDVQSLNCKAIDYLDKVKFSFDKREFEGIVARVEVTSEEQCEVGSKITGRYGNKGVISLILPDAEMPMTNDGRTAEVVCNSLGVIGRLNPSQLYEHELNFIAETLLMRLRSGEINRKKFIRQLKRLYEIACSDSYFNYFNEFSEDDLDVIVDEMLEYDIIRVEQAPFHGNTSLEGLMTLYSEFKIDKIKFRDIQTPLVFAKLYFVKLTLASYMGNSILVTLLIVWEVPKG